MASTTAAQLMIDARTRWRVVGAASLGTVFEWFDFFLYGSLVTVFGALFFPPGHATAGLLAALAAFGAGFVVRPLGAILFGHLGDRIGRKTTFLATVALMGAATVAIGLLPTYPDLGIAAPVLLVLMRLLQGLAVGGEFGGAATYVAEYAPRGRRAFYTSFIMATGTLGLILALLAIYACRSWLGEAAFRTWGWRLPFLASVLLLWFSIHIRLRLDESPLFAGIRARGAVARTPLSEVLGQSQHRRAMWIAFVCLTAAQGVVWNAGQFYPLVHLQTALKLDVGQSALLMSGALLLALPLFPLAGWLADRYGRRPLVIGGFALAALVLLPLFHWLGIAAGPPPSLPTMLAALVALAVPVALVCAPASAFLVELFPTRVRYTAMGIPYHLGNGWFGGFMPFATAALSLHFEHPLAGLYYPIAMCVLCGLCAVWLMPETRDRDLASL
jgi:MFS family permease